MICWNRSCQLTGMRYVRTSQLRRLGLPLDRGDEALKETAVPRRVLRPQQKIRPLWVDGNNMDNVMNKRQARGRFKRRGDDNSYTEYSASY